MSSSRVATAHDSVRDPTEDHVNTTRDKGHSSHSREVLAVVVNSTGCSFVDTTILNFRASDANPSKLITSKMMKQVCFLIIQGCQDDLMSSDCGFTKFVEDLDFVSMLRTISVSNHEDLKPDDVRELVLYTIERCNDARELLLNIPVGGAERTGAREESPVTAGVSFVVIAHFS